MLHKTSHYLHLNEQSSQARCCCSWHPALIFFEIIPPPIRVSPQHLPSLPTITAGRHKSDVLDLAFPPCCFPTLLILPCASSTLLQPACLAARTAYECDEVHSVPCNALLQLQTTARRAFESPILMHVPGRGHTLHSATYLQRDVVIGLLLFFFLTTFLLLPGFVESNWWCLTV